MSEGLNFQKNTKSLESHKSSEELRNGYLNLIESSLKEYLVESRIPKEKRRLEPIFNDPNKPATFIEKTRDPSSFISRSNVWLVVDFDDVINNTTTYNEQFRKEICKITGQDENEFKKLWEEHKIANNNSKKAFRFGAFMEKIKEMYPEKKDQVNLFVNSEDLNKFVNQGVRRALLSLQNGNIGIPRISILTFGDIDYQKTRINKTDLPEIVDEIIYTEGSKREVLETLIERDYKSKGAIPPFVISIDDSPEQVNDYNDVNLQNNFINMHFENPQAKRFGKKPIVEQVVTNLEDKKNEAAVNIRNVAKICQGDEMQKSREQIYKMLQGKNLWDFYHSQDEYKMGRYRVLRTTTSSGEPLKVTFASGYSPGSSEGKKISKFGRSDDDYWNEVKDLVAYPSSETDITYSEDLNGNVYRESDVHTMEGNKEKMEDKTKHRKILVIEGGKLVYEYASLEDEFIRQAK